VNILVVEDNDMIMRLVMTVLDDADTKAQQADPDVRHLMNHETWEGVDVALVDLLLPGTVGDELLSWLAAHAPHVRRIAMSGSGEARLEEARDAQIRLLKPFTADDLLDAVRAPIDS
jgi:DNA-binding NtrC family response regulator